MGKIPFNQMDGVTCIIGAITTLDYVNVMSFQWYLFLSLNLPFEDLKMVVAGCLRRHFRKDLNLSVLRMDSTVKKQSRSSL
jgi:hypothetical protein